MALYIAGVAFKNEEWKKAAWDFEHKVMAEQYPEGYWSENFGPVVSYNMVYSEPWASTTISPRTRPCSRPSTGPSSSIAASSGRTGRPHPAIDERVIYHKSINTGNVGFSYSPEGRGFILSQLAKAARAAGREGVGGDYAAQMLLYGGQGTDRPAADRRRTRASPSWARTTRSSSGKSPGSGPSRPTPRHPSRTAGSRTARTMSTSSTPSWAWWPAAGTPSSSPTGPPSPSATRAS